MLCTLCIRVQALTARALPLLTRHQLIDIHKWYSKLDSVNNTEQQSVVFIDSTNEVMW